MFTITGLTKTLPDGSRTILKNINLCFFPGAKIGVVGLNGSGKSSLLKIMAGVDKSFTGTAVPMVCTVHTVPPLSFHLFTNCL